METQLHSLSNWSQNRSTITWLQKYSVLLLILGLATGLRLYQLGTESLWLDEINSIVQTIDGRGLPPNNLIRPVYYILLKIWLAFGSGDAWLRGLGVIFGVLSVVLTCHLGQRLINALTGLTAAFLLAVSPFALNQSQEVRMYSLGLCLGLVGTLAIVHLLEHQKKQAIAWWVGARLLCVWTLPLSSALLFPDILLVLLKFRHQPEILRAFRKGFVIFCLCWSLSFLKLLRRTPGFMGEWVAHRPKPTPFDFLDTLRLYTVFSPTEQLTPPTELHTFALRLFVMLLVGVVTVALLQKPRQSKVLWLVAWAVIPLMAFFVVSHLMKSIWLHRYMSFVSPYLLLLVAAGFSKLWQRQKLIAIPLAVFYLALLVGGLFPYYTTLHRPNWREAVQVISSEAQPQDAIAVYPPVEARVLNYYDKGAIPNYDLVPENIGNQPEVIKQSICQLAAKHDQLWIALQTGFARISPSYKASTDAIQTVIQDKFGVKTQRNVGGGLVLYTSPFKQGC